MGFTFIVYLSFIKMKGTLLLALFLASVIAVKSADECYSNARARAAWQDSIGWDGDPMYAVDENRDQNYGGESCSHTLVGDSHWWATGLETEYSFNNVRIYNRLDCCTNRLNHLTVYAHSEHHFDEHNPMKNMVECGSWSADGDSPGIVDIFFDKPCKGRHILIEMKNPGSYLTLCEVEFCNRENPRNWKALVPINIVGNDVWQDSVGWDGLPSRANDGNKDQYWGGASCSHTAVGDIHWWAVEFAVLSTFKAVRIHNRLDCCTDRLNGLTVYTSESRHFADCNPMRDMVECAHWSYHESSPSIVEIWADKPCTGKYALIEMKNPGNYLTLCEVEFAG